MPTRKLIQTDSNPFIKEINEAVANLNAVLTRAYEAGVKANVSQDYLSDDGDDGDDGDDPDETGLSPDPLYLFKVVEISQTLYEQR